MSASWWRPWDTRWGEAHTCNTNKSSHKLPTGIQQTVNIFRKEHVYGYAILFLGVRVCLEGVCLDT